MQRQSGDTDGEHKSPKEDGLPLPCKPPFFALADRARLTRGGGGGRHGAHLPYHRRSGRGPCPPQTSRRRRWRAPYAVWPTALQHMKGLAPSAAECNGKSGCVVERGAALRAWPLYLSWMGLRATRSRAERLATEGAYNSAPDDITSSSGSNASTPDPSSTGSSARAAACASCRAL